MRKRGRTDDNHKEIRDTFRDLHCSVADTSGAGDGFPDIVVGLRNNHGECINLMVEIKDGSKPPSKRKLTKAQVDFHRDWK